ncbi:MAG: arylsulfatase [Acidimicrobiia bacterium]
MNDSPRPRLTLDDSTAPQIARRDRPDGPNVVLIILDDLGFAQLACFGSDIETPNIDRLAANGLRYNRFHVTAICSPTRACLLTGRNSHAVGMGYLTDMPMTFPGYTARIPKSAATLPRILRDAGYNTMAVGKWHLVPAGERSNSGPFDRWPLGFGFERYYGFLQGDTNHWSPNLVRDNHYIDPPRGPDEGYHLTEDLADTAIAYVQDQQNAARGRPFFLSFATGAVHAPHHVAPEWIERYRGRFDDGWEAWRERTFVRQRELGIVPEDASITERPSWVQDWRELPEDQRRLFAHQQEVFAGFLSHTDAQIGRVLDHLEEIGVLDDTIVMLVSDNGTSAEGGVIGSFNEHRFTQMLPESLDDNLAHYDEFGGVRSYNHYAWGWAWAGNTPFHLWKRFTWLGGTRTPLIVHWPNGFAARGEVRDQILHAIDVMPTVLAACGVKVPEAVDGVAQQPIDGADFRSTFDDPRAASPRAVQYFELMGSRSIIADGWKATTDHVPTGVADEERMLVGSRDFADDRWALFDLDDDFSEARDVAAEHPEIVTRLEQQWLTEAVRNQVLPLVDSFLGRMVAGYPPPDAPRSRSVYRPDGSPVPDDSVPRLFGAFQITADVDVTSTPAEGILCSMGDWTSGFAFCVLGGNLAFLLNRAGDEVRVVSDVPVPRGRHVLACRYVPSFDGDPMLSLLHDDTTVASVALGVAMPFVWQHGGTALCLGFDRGFPVTDDYAVPFRWNGILHEVVVDTSAGAIPPDSTRLAHAERVEIHRE